MDATVTRYKVIVFVPEAFKEQLKQAMFAQGAGRYDGYDCCSWESVGQGQFRPLESSQPFIGQSGQLETVTEYRIEMVCAKENIKSVLAVMLEQHPYEVPAYEVWPIYSIDDF